MARCAPTCRCKKHQPETAVVALPMDRKTARREADRKLKEARKYGR